ncbi:alpha/beta hydrolase [Chitinibacter tainanensis]|uniref:alpha/beta hydrolase n=1 Tax=Chitinibacter tainanensis TaxID=230667 RepID=UPI00040F7056|nr:alpha/beta hydrolase [Chitinibacter tainanensis]
MQCAQLSATEWPYQGLLFSPSTPDPQQRVLVYLHGAGERGEDLSLLTRYGLPALLASGALTLDFAVLCPQTAAGQDWQIPQLCALLAQLRQEGKTVLLAGYSLGGLAITDLLAHTHAECAGYLVIAGQARMSPLSVGSAAILTVQGDLDDWADTRQWLAQLQAQGHEAGAVVLPGEAHFISELIYQQPAILRWLNARGFGWPVPQ